MDRPARPVRNRRHSRRAWPPGDAAAPTTGHQQQNHQSQHQQHQHRLQKRLFTPEIKRMLKDWLVRRRDNPYPSRDEKKTLAVSSGLTYIQICNWFANWRRKLKNAGREPTKRTWGNLIKNYNTSANGNVEQFSISSNDSIWGDETAVATAGVASAAAGVAAAAAADQQQRLQLGQQQQFHPVYRSNHVMQYDATVPTEQTIEYYDRYGELVSRTTASALAPPTVPSSSPTCVPMLLGQQHQLPYFNIADRSGGYFYGYFDSAQPVNGVRLDNAAAQEQCFQISSTSNMQTRPASTSTVVDQKPAITPPNNSQRSSPVSIGADQHRSDGRSSNANTATATTTTAKYKSNIMEKYLRDLQPQTSDVGRPTTESKPDAVVGVGIGRQLSKWLESAANFTPDKKNYIEWEGGVRSKDPKSPTGSSAQQRTTSECHSDQSSSTASQHEREELEAAEALTSLAGNYRSRMFGMAVVAPRH